MKIVIAVFSPDQKKSVAYRTFKKVESAVRFWEERIGYCVFEAKVFRHGDKTRGIHSVFGYRKALEEPDVVAISTVVYGLGGEVLGIISTRRIEENEGG